MVLTAEIQKSITDFVYKKPRTVQEIAHLISKNWRTANSYVDKINQEQGTLSSRTFREGTRGALKIVYWNNLEKISSTEFQERLFKKIEAGKGKSDFSPFDIYQYVEANKRRAFLEEQEDEAKTVKQDVAADVRSAEQQILIFSSNFSWANIVQNNVKLMEVFEDAAKRNISIKILAKVDITSTNNISKILSLNHKLGKEAIEVRHCEQPLRAFVIDSKIARFKEIKESGKGKTSKKKQYIFYEIYDEEWIEWIKKVFWNFFRTSISAERRLEDIKSIQKIT